MEFSSICTLLKYTNKVFALCYIPPLVLYVCMYLFFLTSELLNLSSSLQVLQSSDLPAGLVSIITGSKDQLTSALATHSVIKAIWYWGSAEVSEGALRPKLWLYKSLRERETERSSV